ncbi:MAG: ActS/PrrB/RegB family redox-sensitive histidine kinase [Alphaproteobacteria bacterium]|nr:ActS/PrrB/RegB family redox-sensitive histidine kinase [Alphaproteobacteria bacterium]
MAAPDMPRGRVRADTLVFLRWMALGGQASAIFAVHFVLDYHVPLYPVLGTLAALAAFNAYEIYRHGRGTWLSERDATLALAFDILQLAALVFLTGGIGNPFVFLFLAPITISASTLSLRSTVLLDHLAIACVSVVALWHEPLPWPGGLVFPELYVFGTWAALVSGIVFLSAYAWRVAQEARAMSDALAATQYALAREQRLAALGGLAAAVAHELGSPLGTIAVIAKELDNELEDGSPLKADAVLLRREAARCRDILRGLSHHKGGDDFLPTELPALVENAASPHRGEGIRVEIAPFSTDGTSVPTIRHVPEILHGLGNLVQNAADFAATRVQIGITWNAQRVQVTVEDDGPGFAPEVLAHLGQPYVSTRRDSGEGMGLGVFISKTLLGRTGASVEFGNRVGGGARIVVEWPRRALEGAEADNEERTETQ